MHPVGSPYMSLSFPLPRPESMPLSGSCALHLDCSSQEESQPARRSSMLFQEASPFSNLNNWRSSQKLYTKYIYSQKHMKALLCRWPSSGEHHDRGKRGRIPRPSAQKDNDGSGTLQDDVRLEGSSEGGTTCSGVRTTTDPRFIPERIISHKVQDKVADGVARLGNGILATFLLQTLLLWTSIRQWTRTHEVYHEYTIRINYPHSFSAF